MSDEVSGDVLARIPRRDLGAGVLLRVRHPPFDIVVGLDGDVPFALEDACPHSGASLSRGCVARGALVCPMHGWEIDLRTGEVRTAVGRGRSNPVYDAELVADEVIVRARQPSDR